MHKTHDSTLDAVHVAANPYPWPYDGDLQPSNTALIVIDMQTDFCGQGRIRRQDGLRPVADPRADRADPAAFSPPCGAKGYTIIHTREGHRPDLSDLPANKRWRSQRIGAGIGDAGPCGRILVRGEPGWEIIPELAPQPGEPIIDKPGKGSFYATDLELLLHRRRRQNLILTGITTDVCVHTTMREANDRGFECLLLEDCCGATDLGNHPAALKMITMQGGVFGAVAHLRRPFWRSMRMTSHVKSQSAAAVERIAADRQAADRRSRRGQNLSKRLRLAAGARDVSMTLRPGTSAPSRRERRRQKHARQVHHGDVSGRLRLGPGRRQRRRAEEPAAGPRPGPRHGLPALHAGREHDRRREHRHGARHVPGVINWKRETEQLAPSWTTMPFRVDPRAVVRNLSAGEKQKVEILKQLYLQSQGADSRRADLGADARRRRTKCWAWSAACATRASSAC